MKRSDLLIETIVEEKRTPTLKEPEELGEPISFYEYVIEGDKIEEREMRGNKKSNKCFYVYSYRGEKRVGGGRFIYSNEFGIVNRNRIYSYEKDFMKYSKILINHLENHVEKIRHKLEKQEQILETLKNIP